MANTFSLGSVVQVACAHVTVGCAHTYEICRGTQERKLFYLFQLDNILGTQFGKVGTRPLTSRKTTPAEFPFPDSRCRELGIGNGSFCS